MAYTLPDLPYAYDAANNLTEITDPRGNKTKFTYDAQRRV
jgi:YD repeat-containing protein